MNAMAFLRGSRAAAPSVQLLARGARHAPWPAASHAPRRRISPGARNFVSAQPAYAADQSPHVDEAERVQALTRNPNLKPMGLEEAMSRMAAIAQQRSDASTFAGPRGDWWWTGPKPHETAGWTEAGALTSLALPNLATCTRAQALDYFDNTWLLTEASLRACLRMRACAGPRGPRSPAVSTWQVLFSGLAHEAAFYVPPYHQLRHPLIFYYGHARRDARRDARRYARRRCALLPGGKPVREQAARRRASLAHLASV